MKNQFKTTRLYENRREVYDSIETVWPDKLGLSIMIIGGLLVSVLSLNLIEKPLIEDTFAYDEPIEVGDEKVVVLPKMSQKCIENMLNIWCDLEKVARIEVMDTIPTQVEVVQEVSKQAHSETLIVKPIPVKVEKKEVVIEPKIEALEKLNMDDMYIFVRDGEGAFQAEAFCDSYYKTDTWLIRHPPHLCEKWTIWFWTNSYQWEIITYEEAVNRKQRAIDSRNNSITSTCLTPKQRIVAVDFIYQYSSKYANQMRSYANNCEVDKLIQYIVAHRDYYKGKKQWGLVKREQRRINYFYNS